MTAEPMTTEELDAIRGAIERTDLFDEETLPLAFSDRKRLLAEVDRLRAETCSRRDLLVAEEIMRNAELAQRRALAERDALAAKLEAALKLRCCVCNASLGYVNHTGLQFCGPCANGETPDPETTRETVQPGRGETETPEGSTDRGTGGPAAQNPVQAAVPQTASERIAQIRSGLADLDTVEHGTYGTQGRYRWASDNPEGRRNMRTDLAWLLDHVDRLNVVLADEQPDVDGWEITATPRGPMVSHSTDADLRVLVADQGDPLPVGAVLAFIADQEGQADA